MGLTLVMVKENAWRTVKLRHHYTLGAVYDKCAIFRHVRNFAHVDLLLFNVLDFLTGGFFVVNNQSDFDAQWCGIGNAARDTLFDVKDWLTKLVVHIFQLSTARIADNWKDRLEGRVQTRLCAIFCTGAHLQKFAVRVGLDCQQIGQIHLFG